MRVCVQCGTNLRVRRSLCRSCRRRNLGKGTALVEVDQKVPKAADLEPPHSRPWVRRGSGSRAAANMSLRPPKFR